MSIAERSIAFHRQTFKLWMSFIALILVMTVYSLFAFENPKFFIYSFLATAAILSIPTIYSYRNWRFIEKNKKELDMLNIDVESNLILTKK